MTCVQTSKNACLWKEETQYYRLSFEATQDETNVKVRLLHEYTMLILIIIDKYNSSNSKQLSIDGTDHKH